MLEASSDDSLILAIYKKILTITQAMCNAAKAGEWDYLCSLGTHYHEAVEKLMLAPQTQPTNQQEESERALLLREILKNDAEVRDLTMPELARIGSMISHVSKQKSMLHAYGLHAGSPRQ
jgi:flagellar protein FliT